MSRKLVTIRTVSEVNPIEGADSIECLTVEGWKVVSQKGNFMAGDPCVYFEIDSLLPDGNPLWQDLVDKSSRVFEGKKGHVLKTIKLRGQVSQGFCIPLRKFEEIKKSLGLTQGWHDNPAIDDGGRGQTNFLRQVLSLHPDFKDIRNYDFAELLGVVKYEAPIPAELAGQVKGMFPSKIRKTDQERCQNLGAEIFADLDAKYEVSVKLDGTSMTVYHDPDGEGGVCSRNLELKVNDENKDNTMIKLARESGLLERLKQFPNYAVQGELMGPGIQGNREQLNAPRFFVFDIFDISRGEYVSPAERIKFVMDNADVGVGLLHHVPVLHASISLRELGITNMDELLAFAEGKSLKHDVREGVVFKRGDGKFSFKAISNKFLLKQKD